MERMMLLLNVVDWFLLKNGHDTYISIYIYIFEYIYIYVLR